MTASSRDLAVHVTRPRGLAVAVYGLALLVPVAVGGCGRSPSRYVGDDELANTASHSKRADGNCAAQLTVVPRNPILSTTFENWIVPQDFRFEIRNLGTRPLVLVQPGDGSASGLRTPTVTWSVRDESGLVPQLHHRIDNLTNSPEPEEIFRLEPNESRTLLHWMAPVIFSKPGVVEVRLHYVNDPGQRWTGHGERDPAVMKLVHDSDYCDLTSDPVSVVVRVEPQSGK